MNKQLRQIIREEIYMVMNEFMQDNPVELAQDMVSSAQAQVDYLEDELKWKDRDSKVSGLPKDTKDARIAAAKVTKDRLEQAKKDLEMAKQSEVSAVQFNQMQMAQTQQDTGQSQIQPQT